MELKDYGLRQVHHGENLHLYNRNKLTLNNGHSFNY
jgi:hypothetical protein